MVQECPLNNSMLLNSDRLNHVDDQASNLSREGTCIASMSSGAEFKEYDLEFALFVFYTIAVTIWVTWFHFPWKAIISDHFLVWLRLPISFHPGKAVST